MTMPTPSPPAVDARGVSLTFETADGEVQALAGVDLAVAPGEFVSFIGPSGCGKTTLLRIIADLERPSAGSIVVNGEVQALAGFERKFPWQLSGGMQQRASIARALSFEPELLLMDEPFGALDEIVRDHLNEQLLRLWSKTGKTVLFVTHSIPEAVFLSTRIVVMSPRPGRVIDEIDCDFPRDRTLEIRETPEFLKIAQRVRAGLRSGHSYDE